MCFVNDEQCGFRITPQSVPFRLVGFDTGVSDTQIQEQAFMLFLEFPAMDENQDVTLGVLRHR